MRMWGKRLLIVEKTSCRVLFLADHFETHATWFQQCLKIYNEDEKMDPGASSVFTLMITNVNKCTDLNWIKSTLS